jgi:hypothetical protein
MEWNWHKRWQSNMTFGIAARGGLLLLLAACFALPARADLVSGRVTGAEGKFQPNDSFVVKNADGKVVKQVKTDEFKGFSVFLQPGSYKAEFVDKDKSVWQSPLESYPQPARQDIQFKKK